MSTTSFPPPEPGRTPSTPPNPPTPPDGPPPTDHTAPVPPHPTDPTAPQPAWTQSPPPRKAPGAGRRIGELTAVALLSAALATGGTWGAMTLANDGASPTSRSASSDSSPAALPISTAQKNAPDWTAVAGAVSPSVVAIRVEGSNGQGGEGSGVIIDDQAHVLTNNHVVGGAGRSPKITVTLANGRSYAAEITGTDPSTDLAVIAMKDAPSDLTAITMGSSKDLAVGDPVMAVGNPLGLAGTVTTGIVSALDRPVTTEATTDQPSSPFGQGNQQTEPVITNAIQTSAAINPGNSGGALVDAAGRLVGINSSIASLGQSSGGQSGNIGIGFAIPVDEAQRIAKQLIETGKAEHAFLGVVPADGTATVDGSTLAGAVVRDVTSGTPAAKANLQNGDLITAVGGDRVESAVSLVGHIRQEAVGSTVQLTIVRDGKEQTVDVTLASRPSS